MSQDTTLPAASSGALARLCLSVVLMCGLVGWVNATSHNPQSLAAPFAVEQLEQFAWAGNGDGLRVRPDLGKGGVRNSAGPIPNPNISESLWDLVAPATTVLVIDPTSASNFYLLSIQQLPSLQRYCLPAPREPPSA